MQIETLPRRTEQENAVDQRAENLRALPAVAVRGGRRVPFGKLECLESNDETEDVVQLRRREWLESGPAEPNPLASTPSPRLAAPLA